MAFVGKRTTQTWLNADGLYLTSGVDEGVAQTVGEYDQPGPRHVIEVIIDLDSLPTLASGNTQIQSDTITLPKGALIEKVDVIVTEVTAGTNANLNVGLVKLDRTTVYDADGILAAADAFNASALGLVTEYLVGTTEVGSAVGTVLTESCYITAAPETADWTAGVVKVRIYYSFNVATDLAA